MPFFQKITGERLYLSPPDTDSEELYVKWLNDPEVSTNLSLYSQVFPFSRKQMEYPKEHSYTIVLKDGDRPIGTVNLMDVDHLHQRATLGIHIGESDCRGKGYGAEAIKLIIDYGFKHLHLHNIQLHVQSTNEQGIACYKKVGFKEFGRRHECGYINGQYIDSVHMEIINNAI